MDRLLHEKRDKYKCFLEDDEVHFVLNVDSDTLSYTLSGHPYMPTFIAKCDNDTYSYSEEGGLWFPKDTDSDWGGFCEELADKLEKNYFAKNKTFDEKIIDYEMGGRDKQLANIAQLIVVAYNGECKPHIIPKEKKIAPPYYKWKHSPEGYSILTSDAENFDSPTVLVTDEHINDFVEHVFLVLAGDTEIKWNKVYISGAVKHALNEHFGMKVDLSNIGPDHETECIFGTPKLPIRPTIWVDHDIQVDDYKRDILLREGFKCYKHDKETWGLEL